MIVTADDMQLWLRLSQSIVINFYETCSLTVFVLRRMFSCYNELHTILRLLRTKLNTQWRKSKQRTTLFNQWKQKRKLRESVHLWCVSWKDFVSFQQFCGSCPINRDCFKTIKLLIYNFWGNFSIVRELNLNYNIEFMENSYLFY